MKRISGIILLLIISLTAHSQEIELEKNLNVMLENTIKENYGPVLDLTYPKIFEIFPREKMLEILPKLTNGDGYTIKLMDTHPDYYFGEIKKVDGGSYMVIRYNSKMKMTFTDPVTEEELKTLMPVFKENMQTEDISFNKLENAFYIRKRSAMIAAKDQFTNNQWRFLNNDNPKLLQKILGEKILKALGL